MTALGSKPRGRPFEKGNPGRPKGSRNKTTLALEGLLANEADAIIAKAAEMAVAGDHVALRLCFDRVLGPRRDHIVSLELPPIKSVIDGANALAAVVAGVAAGAITPKEGAELAAIVSSTMTAFERADLEVRVERLEKGEGKL